MAYVLRKRMKCFALIPGGIIAERNGLKESVLSNTDIRKNAGENGRKRTGSFVRRTFRPVFGGVRGKV
jgi:hypothetical protein